MVYKYLYDNLKKKKNVRAGLIGSGHFGTAVVTQSIVNPLLKIPVIADSNIEAAKLAYRRAEIPEDDIIECNNYEETLSVIGTEKYAVVKDPMLLMKLPLDAIVESTGIPEAGARYAYEAIQSGKHVIMINKETDSAVGPILKHLASEAGVVYTPVDGDQHGLLMGLVSWAEGLGLKVISGGKSRDVEFIYDEKNGTVTCEADGITVHQTRTVALSEEDKKYFEMIPPGRTKEFNDKRQSILKELPRVGAFDFCELVIAANATGLIPDIPEMHQPIVKISEIPEVFSVKEDGGIFAEKGVIDVATCLRKKDEAGLGGGVFIVVSCDNDYSRMILKIKGCIVNNSGSTALIYRPYHLCGVETSTSILSAGLLGVSTGSDIYLPRYDVIKRATRDMKAEEIFGNDHDESIEGLIVPAEKMSKTGAVPAHLLTGNKLNRDITSGTIITYDMIHKPVDSVLWSLRQKQDEIFALSL